MAIAWRSTSRRGPRCGCRRVVARAAPALLLLGLCLWLRATAAIIIAIETTAIAAIITVTTVAAIIVPVETAIIAPPVKLAPVVTPVITAAIPAAMKTMAAIIIYAQRGAEAPFAPPAGMRPAPFVIAPVAMDPELTMAERLTVIDRAVIPIAMPEHGAIIDRHLPEIVGAAELVAIAAGVIREADSAAWPEPQAEGLCAGRHRRRRSCGQGQRGHRHLPSDFNFCAPRVPRENSRLL